jgi:hypothetical protein
MPAFRTLKRDNTSVNISHPRMLSLPFHLSRDRYVNRATRPGFSDARCNTPCQFDIGLVDQDLSDCNASRFTSVGRGKRPNRGHEGGRPLDLRHRQGASTSEIHRLAGWLKAGNERGLRALGFEAIYVFIYRAARKGEDLWRYLTRRHKRRRPRRARPSRDTIKDRASIHDRPKDIEARADIGHWEGDLIICKRTPMLVILTLLGTKLKRLPSYCILTGIHARAAANIQKSVRFH